MKTKTKQKRRDASVQGEDVDEVLGQILLDSILDVNLNHPVLPASTAFVDCGYACPWVDECWLWSTQKDTEQRGDVG